MVIRISDLCEVCVAKARKRNREYQRKYRKTLKYSKTPSKTKK